MKYTESCGFIAVADGRIRDVSLCRCLPEFKLDHFHTVKNVYDKQIAKIRLVEKVLLQTHTTNIAYLVESFQWYIVSEWLRERRSEMPTLLETGSGFRAAATVVKRFIFVT